MNHIKKIVFCIPSLGTGGAERVISVLSNEFTERGFDVSVLMICYENNQYPLNEKVNIVSLNCDKDNTLPIIKRYPLRLKKIRNAIKEISPDVVISFMSETNIDVCFALWNTNIPIIVSERNDPKIDPASKAKKILRKIAFLKPKGFVFQTPDAKSYFSKRIQNKSSIILNPLNPNLPSYVGVKERDKRVVAVGRLNSQKNFKLLIDSFSVFLENYEDYILEIYGEGTLEPKLNDYIRSKNLQDKVFLKGFCKDVHSKILNASMFVMSSDFEGMPNALLESMAIGLPCISTDCPCGGPRMLIENKKNGILTQVGNKEELIEAMNYIAADSKRAEEMALLATKVNNIAKLEGVADAWISFINERLD